MNKMSIILYFLNSIGRKSDHNRNSCLFIFSLFWLSSKISFPCSLQPSGHALLALGYWQPLIFNFSKQCYCKHTQELFSSNCSFKFSERPSKFAVNVRIVVFVNAQSTTTPTSSPHSQRLCQHMSKQSATMPKMFQRSQGLRSSVVDPGRFDADPDPTFQADADPDPKLVQLWRKKNFFQIFIFFFSIILHKFS